MLHDIKLLITSMNKTSGVLVRTRSWVACLVLNAWPGHLSKRLPSVLDESVDDIIGFSVRVIYLTTDLHYPGPGFIVLLTNF